MKIFNSVEEMKPYYIENNSIYVINDDVTFNFDLYLDGSIFAYNITAKCFQARNVTAKNVTADNFTAGNVKLHNLDALRVSVSNMEANNVNCCNFFGSKVRVNSLKCWDVYLGNLKAVHIDAEQIEYFDTCTAEETLKCVWVKRKTICGGSHLHQQHECKNGKIEYKPEKKYLTIPVTTKQLQRIKELLEESK